MTGTLTGGARALHKAAMDQSENSAIARKRVPSAWKSARGRGRRAGFSLLEILIVLTIIGLLATLVGPRLLAQLDRSKATTARVQVKSLVSALDTMRLDLGRYPSEAEGLALLVAEPGGGATWYGPYLNGGVPNDPWGRPYVYQPPKDLEGRPRVGSLGADGAQGGSALAADIFSDDR